MKYQLFVKPSFEILETEQVFIAVKIGSKPDPGGYFIVFKKIICAQLEHQVEPGIIIDSTPCKGLVGSVQKAEIYLAGYIICIECGFIDSWWGPYKCVCIQDQVQVIFGKLFIIIIKLFQLENVIVDIDHLPVEINGIGGLGYDLVVLDFLEGNHFLFHPLQAVNLPQLGSM